MAVRYLNTFTVVSLFILALTANGDRLRDDMYDPLYGVAACYRRMNGTHQTGCSSKRGGSVGIVHIVTSQLDVDWVLNNSTGEQYAVVLPVELLTPAYLDRLIQRPDKVAGIVVTRNDTTKPVFFSHESRCPNSLSQAPVQAMQCREDAADSEVWNPHGTSLAHRDIPFPIFFLPPDKEDSIEPLYKCFYRFNSFDLENQLKRSLCALEMDAFMFAAVNSEVCIRKNLAVKNLSNGKFCDPLGDRSVYFTLFPRGPYSDSPSEYFIKNAANDTKVERKAVKEEEKSIFLVTANMDSTSFLEAEGIGAVGTISGLVTLLATAQLLNTMFPANQHSDYEKNVLFMALNGESYDGIGSQRLAWDLSVGGGGFPAPGGPAPPLDLRTLGRHVHLAQLATPHTDLRAYTPQYGDDKDDRVDEMLTWLTAAGSKVGVTTLLARGGRHPPSPVHSFLRILNSTTNHISSVVLADHGPQFSNQYYHSIMDDKDNLNYTYLDLPNTTKDGSFPDSLVPKDSIQMRLANISTMVAHTLYRHITGKAYAGGLKASPYIVDELIHCFLETSTCPLLLASLSAPPTPEALSPQRPPASLYVGVTSWMTQHPQQVALLSVLLAGTPVNRTQELCHAEDTDPQLYEWMMGLDGKGHCYRANLNYSVASSPAFEIPDYDFKSGLYSSWTESVWAGMYLTLLVLPARHWETTTLVLGCIVSLLSVILVLLTQRHLAVLQSQARDSVETDSSNVDC